MLRSKRSGWGRRAVFRTEALMCVGKFANLGIVTETQALVSLRGVQVLLTVF